MENHRDKIQKTSHYKNQEDKETASGRRLNPQTTLGIFPSINHNQFLECSLRSCYFNKKTSWSDLPQKMLELILRKLVHPLDVIRFRAVCKNWDLSKYHHRLPSLCSFSWAAHSNILECQVTDPNSAEVFKTSKSVNDWGFPCYRSRITVYGSEQEWLIAGYHAGHKWWLGTSIFMYNTCSKEYISLPCVKQFPRLATLSCNPGFQDCQVFLICDNHPKISYIASYRLHHKDKEWKVGFVGAINERCYGMQYIKEQLFCLFKGGTLKRYNLEDGSCRIIGKPWGVRMNHSIEDLWLIKCKDILVACRFGSTEVMCSTFYFDWSDMSWVENDLPESMDIIICDKLAMIRPLVDNHDYENTKNCRLYVFDCSSSYLQYKYYSLVKGRWEWLDFCRNKNIEYNILDIVALI